MKAATNRKRRPSAAELCAPQMRAALAVRNWPEIYRQLQKYGFSQAAIGAMTGQPQPQVSAIVHGRKMMAYDTMRRAAIGLRIPLHMLGMSSECCGHPAIYLGAGNPPTAVPSHRTAPAHPTCRHLRAAGTTP